MENLLDTKPIGELLEYNFKIPSYQRGYRWNADQVKDLLTDIWTYEINTNNPNAFYCLQPVVVKEINGKLYELIDGQQRLTTILLILHYFNETEFRTPKKIYSLEYETRINQKDFLNTINDERKSEDNIDLFHIYRAHNEIKKWFESMEQKKPSIKGDFYSKLVNKTKIIWFEVKDGSSVVEIFTRLNIGKIPLTNAELIKALFLSKTTNNADENRAHKQSTIAGEWDKIEQTLQKPEFWYFICKYPEKYETRIEFIFDLIQEKKEDDEQYYTFYQYCEAYENKGNNSAAIDKLWLEIKNYFLTFEEWFNDPQFYHLVGYLVTIDYGVDKIKAMSVGISKTDFRVKLKSCCRSSISKPLQSLNYDENKTDIRNVLLLFNIFSILKSEKSSLRFPYNHFHQQNWDIEHIRSQTSKDISGKDKINWANTVLGYFTGIENDNFNDENVQSEMKKNKIEMDYCTKLLTILKGEDTNNSVFNSLYDDLTVYFKETETVEDIDNLSNLTLLDESTNRMYKNAFFPVKRKYIIDKEREGVFIPLCTKNVFLKAYSKKLGEVMYWNTNDAEYYSEEINKILN